MAALLLAVAGIGGGFGALGTWASATGTPDGAAASAPATGAAPPSSIGSLSPGPTGTPLPATPSPSPVPAVPSGALQVQLDALQASLSVPGISVAILWNDGRSWTGVAGSADVAAARPVTPDSGFALASISKTFTAAVVLQLVEEGRLQLDDPVAPLLPAYRLDRRITLRMLLDHTSGLPDFFLNPRIDKALQSSPGATWTPARSWSYVSARRAVPGTRWTYSNANYLLLGELVTAVTGRPLSSEVRSRLLDPLGLADTWYQVDEPPRTPLTVGYRLVAQSGGGLRPVKVAPASQVMPFRSVITAAGGAGSIASTALDTARWMRAFAGGEVLSPEMQRAMLADAVASAGLKRSILYGLGIQVTTLDDRTALGHSGRYLGFRDVVRYLPAEGVTIAVLTNQGTRDPALVADALLRIVLPPLPEPSPSVAPPGSGGPSPSASGSPPAPVPVSPAATPAG